MMVMVMMMFVTQDDCGEKHISVNNDSIAAFPFIYKIFIVFHAEHTVLVSEEMFKCSD